jgi:hypothetical protein
LGQSDYPSFYIDMEYLIPHRGFLPQCLQVRSILQWPIAKIRLWSEIESWVAVNRLVHVELQLEEAPYLLTQVQAMLRQMVLDIVPSLHSKRNYAKALDDLFVFSASRPLSRALLMEYLTTMDHLSPSTINVRLSAIRKLVGEERRNGMIGFEEAANLTDIPERTAEGNSSRELAYPGTGEGASGGA